MSLYITEVLSKIKSDAGSDLQEKLVCLFDNLLAADKTYLVDKHTFAELHWAQSVVELPTSKFFSILTKYCKDFREHNAERDNCNFIAKLAYTANAVTILFYLVLLYPDPSRFKQIASRPPTSCWNSIYSMIPTLTRRMKRSKKPGEQMSVHDIYMIFQRISAAQFMSAVDIHTLTPTFIIACDPSEIIVLADIYLRMLGEAGLWEPHVYSSVSSHLLSNAFRCVNDYGLSIELFKHLIDIGCYPCLMCVCCMIVLMALRSLRAQRPETRYVFTYPVTDTSEHVYNVVAYAIKNPKGPQRLYLRKMLFIIEQLQFFMESIDVQTERIYHLVHAWRTCMLPELCDHIVSKSEIRNYGIDRMFAKVYIDQILSNERLIPSIFRGAEIRPRIYAICDILHTMQSRGLF